LSRGFLQAQFTVNGSPLTVCSVHLDSGKRSARLRARQLRRVFRTLRSVDDAAVLGDFNMRDDENARIVPPYRDVWPTLRPNDQGFTEDTSINLMRFDSKNKRQAGAFRPRPSQGFAMGGREHRTAGHPTDFEKPPASLSIRSLRRDVPPRPTFGGTDTSPSATSIPAGLAATTSVVSRRRPVLSTAGG
jgi:hypothetical protein